MASATDGGTNLNCPHCKLALRVEPELCGQTVSCPHCGGYFSIPAATVFPAVSIPPLVISGPRLARSAGQKRTSIGLLTAAAVGAILLLLVGGVLLMQNGQHVATKARRTYEGDNKSSGQPPPAANAKTDAEAAAPNLSRTAPADDTSPAQTIESTALPSARPGQISDKPSPTTIKLSPIDLFADLETAGHRIDGIEFPASATALRQTIIQYLCYGSYKESIAALQGTDDERQRAEDKRADQRKRLSDSITCCLALKNLPVYPVELANHEVPYTALKTTVALHLSRRAGSGFTGLDTTRKNGVIERVVLSRLSPVYWGWRKSDQTLVRLGSPDESRLLQASGGTLFQSEGLTTELLLVTSLPPDLREELKLGTDRLRMTVVVDGLIYDKRDEFGCFNHDQLLKTGFDCDAVHAEFVAERLEDLGGLRRNGTTPPAYFPVAGASDERLLSAMLTAVYLHTTDGQVLGSLTCPQLKIQEVNCTVEATRTAPRPPR